MTRSFANAVAAFGANLRDEHGFAIAHARGQDALRTADVVGIADRERLRHAFRLVYCSSPDEAARFDRAFDRFFGAPDGVPQPDAPPQRTRPGPEGAPEGRGRPAPPHDAAAAWHMLLARYSPGAGRSDPPVIAREGLDALLTAVGTMIASMRLGRSRRWKPSRRGPRFDVRRTLRAGLRTGGDPVALFRLGPPPRNPRFVMLIDGSRSMAEDAGPSLQFAHALCRRTRRAHAFVFSTAMRDVTGALRDRAQAGHALQDLGDAWGGGTRIGENLAAFVRAFSEQLVRRDTVVLIASDGLDAGDTVLLERAMRALRRQSAAIVWLHPSAGDPGFRPAAAGMRAAMPYVTLLAASRGRSDVLALTRAMTRRRAAVRRR